MCVYSKVSYTGFSGTYKWRCRWQIQNPMFINGQLWNNKRQRKQRYLKGQKVTSLSHILQRQHMAHISFLLWFMWQSKEGRIGFAKGWRLWQFLPPHSLHSLWTVAQHGLCMDAGQGDPLLTVQGDGKQFLISQQTFSHFTANSPYNTYFP